MPYLRLILLISLWLTGFSSLKPAICQGKFDFTPEVSEAYKLAVSMRFVESRAAVNSLKVSQPNNLTVFFVENYIDFLQTFIDENKADYKKRAAAVDDRLWKISRGDKKSPYHLYCQAEIRLQRAILNGKFGDYLSAVNEVQAAYKLLEENERKFPDFIPNKRSLGIMHALVGNIPSEYHWALKFLVGMEGTIQQGMREIEEVVAYSEKHPEFIFGEESLLAYSFLLLHLGNQSDAAWSKISKSRLNPKQNPLAAFAMANLASRTGRNDKAIQIIQEAPTGGKYHPFHFLQFMLGVAKLSRLDKDANEPLERFISKHTGEYGIKEAYQKLAWYHLIHENPTGYKFYIAQCKTKGSSRFEPDKAAEREAKSSEIPHPLLLSARLLFDGGYHQRAYDLLLEKEAVFLYPEKNKVEYSYRMGRIAHGLKKSQEAIAFYQKTIENGQSKPWFFACNAALQLGLLHEGQKNKPEAQKAYQACLKMRPEEYGQSLHAKAKAGLNRIR